MINNNNILHSIGLTFGIIGSLLVITLSLPALANTEGLVVNSNIDNKTLVKATFYVVLKKGSNNIYKELFSTTHATTNNKPTVLISEKKSSIKGLSANPTVQMTGKEIIQRIHPDQSSLIVLKQRGLLLVSKRIRYIRRNIFSKRERCETIFFRRYLVQKKIFVRAPPNVKAVYESFSSLKKKMENSTIRCLQWTNTKIYRVANKVEAMIAAVNKKLAALGTR